MKIETPDILERINLDFEEDSAKIIDLLNPLIGKTDYISIDRVTRCILFLAKGDVEKLKFYVSAAISDARDVVFWAEYADHSNDSPLKVNDFSQPFQLRYR